MIANLADQIEWPEGKTLIKQGRLGSEFFILIEGTASVSQDGSKLRDLAAGEWVGEIALITDVPRTATVVATSPIRALVMTRGAFSQLVTDSPSIAAKVLAGLGERVAPETV
jgi:CRP/FNR family transcriptional regulator, cyclic AMP receptor protein